MFRFASIYAINKNPFLQPINIFKNIRNESPGIEDVKSPLKTQFNIGLATWSLISTMGLNFWTIDVEDLENDPEDNNLDVNITNYHQTDPVYYYFRSFLFFTGSFVFANQAKYLFQLTCLSSWIKNPLIYMGVTGVMFGSYYSAIRIPYSKNGAYKYVCWMIASLASGALRACDEIDILDIPTNAVSLYAGELVFIFIAGYLLKKLNFYYYYHSQMRWIITGLLTVSPVLEILLEYCNPPFENIYLTAVTANFIGLHLIEFWHMFLIRLKANCELFDPQGYDPLKEGFLLHLRTVNILKYVSHCLIAWKYV